MSDKQSPAANAPENRRGFLTGALAVIIGGGVGLVPFLAGLVTYLSPLKKKGAGGNLIRVASLDAIPADGTPVQFPVVAARTDAWTRFDRDPIGAVWIRRLADNHVQVFSATCPHAGCFVGFHLASKQFRCPCHTSSFEVDGQVIAPSPSPRAMDVLEVDADKLAQGEVWVKFLAFQSGISEQVAK